MCIRDRYQNLSLPDGSVYEPEDMYKSYVHGQELTMPVPSQEGYVFCGWYDNAGYTGTPYTTTVSYTHLDVYKRQVQLS